MRSLAHVHMRVCMCVCVPVCVCLCVNKSHYQCGGGAKGQFTSCTSPQGAKAGFAAWSAKYAVQQALGTVLQRVLPVLRIMVERQLRRLQ